MNKYLMAFALILLSSKILPAQAGLKVLATTPEWAALTHELGGDKVDVYAATIPTLRFVPGVHVNYAETVLPMRDGLPKLKDFPAELGGSGQQVPE